MVTILAHESCVYKLYVQPYMQIPLTAHILEDELLTEKILLLRV